MKFRVTFAALIIPWFGACERQNPATSTQTHGQGIYDKAIAAGVGGFSEVRDFESLFPGAFHFITYYQEGYGQS